MEEREGKIKKLSIEVINKIAAGEVVVNPAAVLKELLENSIDAGSTEIQISVRSNGVGCLQITDNGTGINLEDMPILCERYTTSKIRQHSDLQEISTFGFRGEALSSISLASKVKVITKTKDQEMAYMAEYKDGIMSGDGLPKCCAGSEGTIIMVNDLFWNNPQRKLKFNGKESYMKIFDVVARYAVQFPSVGFALKKVELNHTDISTNDIAKKKNCREMDKRLLVIQKIYGVKTQNQLSEIHYEIQKYYFSANLLLSGTTTSMHKKTLILFINNRLVENSLIQSSLNKIYSIFLPIQKVFYFAFIQLELKPKYVDVNIHPTKKEVKFRHEEEIIQELGKQITKKLENENEFKSFEVSEVGRRIKNKDYTRSNVGWERVEEIYDKDKARVSNNHKIDDMFMISNIEANMNMNIENKYSINIPTENEEQKDLNTKVDNNIKLHNLNIYKSYIDPIINRIREENNIMKNQEISKVLKRGSHIGIMEWNIALIQYETTVYAYKVNKILWSLLFQKVIFGISKFSTFQLSPPVNITQLFESRSAKYRPFTTLYRQLLKLLFLIYIDEENNLTHLPVVIIQIPPYSQELFELIKQISDIYEEHFDDSSKAITEIANSVATYYSNSIYYLGGGSKKEDLSGLENWIRTYLREYMRNELLISSEMYSHVFKVTEVAKLYKIFERC